MMTSEKKAGKKLPFIPENSDHQKYIIDSTIGKISNIRKQLDWLLLLLFVVSVYGGLNLNVNAYESKPKTEELSSSSADTIGISKAGAVTAKNEKVKKKAEANDLIEIPLLSLKIPRYAFSNTIALVLLIVFGIIGSQLIDYMITRSFLDNYMTVYIKGLSKQDISSIFIPASYPEWMYKLEIYNLKDNFKQLWYPISIIVLSICYFSAVIAVHHLYKGNSPYVGALLICIWLTIYTFLYTTFVRSIAEKTEKVGHRMFITILVLLVVCIIGLSFAYYFDAL